MVVARVRRWLYQRWMYATGPERDRGAVETTDIVMWVAIGVLVAGGVGLLFRDAIESFFNSIVFTIGFGD